MYVGSVLFPPRVCTMIVDHLASKTHTNYETIFLFSILSFHHYLNIVISPRKEQR